MNNSAHALPITHTYLLNVLMKYAFWLDLFGWLRSIWLLNLPDHSDICLLWASCWSSMWFSCCKRELHFLLRLQQKKWSNEEWKLHKNHRRSNCQCWGCSLDGRANLKIRFRCLCFTILWWHTYQARLGSHSCSLHGRVHLQSALETK